MKEDKTADKRHIWHTIKQIFHFITTVLMYAVFLVLLFVGVIIVLYVIDVRKNANSGTYTPPLFGAYVIVSNSMEPTIMVMDAVVVKRMQPEDIKVGDIITFVSTDNRFSGVTITHRVSAIVQSSDGKLLFRTKGDNNNTEDATLVKADYVNGKVILKIPMIGYIQSFLSQSYGWITIVVIPCLGIIIYDIFKLFKLVGKKNKKKVIKGGKIEDEEEEY